MPTKFKTELPRLLDAHQDEILQEWLKTQSEALGGKQVEERELARRKFEREQAIRAVAGYTPVGLGRDRSVVARLRAKGAVAYPEDIGVDKRLATRGLLAARSIKDLVRWSGGLYNPPARFRNW